MSDDAEAHRMLATIGDLRAIAADPDQDAALCRMGAAEFVSIARQLCDDHPEADRRLVEQVACWGRPAEARDLLDQAGLCAVEIDGLSEDAVVEQALWCLEPWRQDR
jgi:hypothetical protein